jgi:hypothetical protein
LFLLLLLLLLLPLFNQTHLPKPTGCPPGPCSGSASAAAAHAPCFAP